MLHASTLPVYEEGFNAITQTSDCDMSPVTVVDDDNGEIEIGYAADNNEINMDTEECKAKTNEEWIEEIKALACKLLEKWSKLPVSSSQSIGFTGYIFYYHHLLRTCFYYNAIYMFLCVMIEGKLPDTAIGASRDRENASYIKSNWFFSYLLGIGIQRSVLFGTKCFCSFHRTIKNLSCFLCKTIVKDCLDRKKF